MLFRSSLSGTGQGTALKWATFQTSGGEPPLVPTEGDPLVTLIIVTGTGGVEAPGTGGGPQLPTITTHYPQLPLTQLSPLITPMPRNPFIKIYDFKLFY